MGGTANYVQFKLQRLIFIIDNAHVLRLWFFACGVKLQIPGCELIRIAHLIMLSSPALYSDYLN